ncbi:hypothetical protein L9F63_000634, partial [Diploptera punctata]
NEAFPLHCNGTHWFCCAEMVLCVVYLISQPTKLMRKVTCVFLSKINFLSSIHASFLNYTTKPYFKFPRIQNK